MTLPSFLHHLIWDMKGPEAEYPTRLLAYLELVSYRAVRDHQHCLAHHEDLSRQAHEVVRGDRVTTSERSAVVRTVL